jgi:hypothetical protein
LIPFLEPAGVEFTPLCVYSNGKNVNLGCILNLGMWGEKRKQPVFKHEVVAYHEDDWYGNNGSESMAYDWSNGSVYSKSNLATCAHLWSVNRSDPLARLALLKTCTRNTSLTCSDLSVDTRGRCAKWPDSFLVCR